MSQGYKRMWMALPVVILLLLVSYADAKQVTQEMAQQAAQAFLMKEQTAPPQVATENKGEFTVRDEAAGHTLGNIQPITDDSGTILAYVQVLEPEGFIITPADDQMGTVLAFSFQGRFPFLPACGNPLLDLIKVDIRARGKALSLGQIDNALNEIAYPTTEWGPYIPTTWSQEGIYNSKCPYIDPAHHGTGRRPTGCTAIAMAQIMYMHKYPDSVSFSYNRDHYISRAPIEDAGGHIIGYDNISIDGHASLYGFPAFDQLNNSLKHILYDGSAEEIANFCFGTGIKLGMTYGREGSGAWRPYAYLDEFGYGSAIHSTHWDDVRDDVVENMKDGLPVQIGIYNSDPSIPGGHSVVVDGYRDDGFFHMNYGWGANSPDPIGVAWYDIPLMPDYDVVAMVIYDIAKYQGWNQIGADQRNSYHAIYPAPVDQPERKWSVTVPPSLPGGQRSFSHLVVGTGGRIYAALNPSVLSSDIHPYIAIYDKFGTREDLIEVPQANDKILYLCQNSRGEIFFASDTAAEVSRLDPKTDNITPIFAQSSPDVGNIDLPIKVDRDDYLYFIVTPHQIANYAKLYCINRTGALQWTTPYSFPSWMAFDDRACPSIDEDRDRVYLNYYNPNTRKSHLIALRRSNGTMVYDEELPTATHSEGEMAVAPAVGNNGTVYIGAYTSLFAYSSDGTLLWEEPFYPAYAHHTPAIGSDGTLYVNYGKLVGGSWRPGYVRALNPANGDTKWELSLPLISTDNMDEIYAASNGMVIYSYSMGGTERLGGAKDNGTSYESRWDIEGGGTLAFGPGRTIVAILPGLDNTIRTFTDKGDRGDPEGRGMNYTDNPRPASPSTPTPANDAVGQDTASVGLSWVSSDAHSLTYDVYMCALGTCSAPAFVPVARGVASATWASPPLKGGTQYLWTVVASDGQAIEEGPVWNFSTEGTSPCIAGDDDGVTTLAREYALGQNYPNPFNPSTVIAFDLPKRATVSITIYNLLGQEVMRLIDQEYPAGSHSITWNGITSNGDRASSGVYFYRLKTEEYIETKKMLLLK